MPPVWPTLVPFEVAEPDADALALVDLVADAVIFGLGLDVVGVLVGSGVELSQGVPVTVAVVFAPVFALAEAAAEAVAVAVLAGVTVGLDVGVLVAVMLSPGLALLPAGVPLVLLTGLVVVAAGVALGLAVLLAWSEGDGVVLGGHTVIVAPARALEMPLGLRPPADDNSGLPVPATPWVPLLLLRGAEEVIPTAWPSWTMAWRSGATARAMPTANTTQAAARADRSSPSCQSRG